MRLTEYIDFLNRDDIGLGQNPKENDYFHITISQGAKRDRYMYQCKLQGKEPVK